MPKLMSAAALLVLAVACSDAPQPAKENPGRDNPAAAPQAERKAAQAPEVQVPGQVGSDTLAEQAPAKDPGSSAPSENQRPEDEPASKDQATQAEPAYAEALLDPEKATLTAPDKYTVRLKTTRGDVLIDVTRAWSPHAADRFFNLVKAGYYKDVAFFRVVAGFMAQAGMHGDPQINTLWARRGIPDEPAKQSNARGMVSFAAAGPNSRSNQFFINFGDNSRLDNYPPSGFPPFGKVRSMSAVDRLYAEYGEGAPMGRGPSQGRVAHEGNSYLKAEFPKLDYILSATVEQ